MPAPAFVQRILSSFPIYEYPEQLVASSSSSSSSEEVYPAAPSKPTFWLHGPGITGEKESFDVDCLKAQAGAVFAGVESSTRWLESSEGAPGATLPALHLPNGDLLPSSAIHAWIAKQRASAGADSEKAGYSVEKDGQQDEDAKSRSENTRIQVRTYTHLIDGKLQPALLAHLFLNSSVYNSLTVPLYFPQTISHSTPGHPARPFLTRYAYSALSKSRKLEMQAELAEKLVPGSGAAAGSWFAKGKGKLDLEDLQRQGEEALQLLEDKIDNEGRGWFFGTEQATDLDAALYANLHIIYILHAPHLGAPNPLRRKLEKCPQLFRWVKRIHKDYF